MSKKIIIDATFPYETRVALLNKNNRIENLELSSGHKKQLKGNIYLAKIIRIEPSLQAAFVDYGNERAGFLPFSEIHPDYYHSLVHDKKDDHKIVGTEINFSEISLKESKEKKPELLDSDKIDIDKIEEILEEDKIPDVDITACEDEIDVINPPAAEPTRGFKIQEVIKKGQVMLVQVAKEEKGNKGAAMTTYISLAGKYCVLMPNKASQNGISRKISNLDERKRLKKIINDLSTQGKNNSFSLIARTAGIGHTTAEFKKDYDYLAKLWNKIRETTLKCKAPSFIHQEDGILLKTIRDMFDNNTKELIIQGESAYAECIKFAKDMLPNEVKRIKEYKSKIPIFTKHGIEEQLIDLYQPTVHLPSGGYIVINPTEALISIDVNSGKSTSERDVEEMALKTNIEAAKEIAKQAILRDLSGLIVIDFIDLAEIKNRKILERSLWEFFSRDKARIQTSTISAFGLLEMSRQRLRPTFLEMNSDICEQCSGKGIVRNKEANAMLILRTIENEIFNGNYDVINVYSSSSSILELLNERREEIALIENKNEVKLNFYIDRDSTADSYSIETIKQPHKIKVNKQESMPKLQVSSAIYNPKEELEEKPEEINKEISANKKRKINKNKRKSFDKPINKGDATSEQLEASGMTEHPQSEVASEINLNLEVLATNIEDIKDNNRQEIPSEINQSPELAVDQNLSDEKTETENKKTPYKKKKPYKKHKNFKNSSDNNTQELAPKEEPINN